MRGIKIKIKQVLYIWVKLSIPGGLRKEVFWYSRTALLSWRVLVRWIAREIAHNSTLLVENGRVPLGSSRLNDVIPKAIQNCSGDIIQRRISEGWSDRKRRLFFNVYYIGRLMNLILYPAMKLTQFFKRGDVSLSFRLSLIWLFFPFSPLCRLTERGTRLFVRNLFYGKLLLPERNVKRVFDIFIFIYFSLLNDKL